MFCVCFVLCVVCVVCRSLRVFGVLFLGVSFLFYYHLVTGVMDGMDGCIGLDIYGKIG